MFGFGAIVGDILGDTTSNVFIPRLSKNNLLNSVIDISIDISKTIFLTLQQKIYSLGSNREGELGLGHYVTTSKLELNQYLVFSDCVSVWGGRAQGGCITESGVVFAFGSTTPLGSIDPRAPTQLYETLGIGERVICGNEFTFVTTTDGRIFSFGSNLMANLAAGFDGFENADEYGYIYKPTISPYFGSGIDLQTGGSSAKAMLLLNSTHLYGWGYAQGGGGVFGWGVNTYGNPRIIPLRHPNRIAQANMTMIRTGKEHGFMMNTEGKVYVWGGDINEFHEIGLGATFFQPTLILHPTLTSYNLNKDNGGIKDIQPGFLTTYVVMNSGQLRVMGLCYYLGVGNGIYGIVYQVPTNHNFFTGANGSQIERVWGQPSTGTTFATDRNGTIWGWGLNGYGVLATGSDAVSIYLVPIVINSLSYMSGRKVVYLTALYGTGMAITNDSVVFTWGNNDWGQLGLGYMSSAIFTPTMVPGFKNVISVGGGSAHSFIINQCPDGYSGGMCDEYVCGNYPASAFLTCAGVGKCVGPNTCVCDPPSAGPNCQFKQYIWYGGSGSWSRPINWYTKRKNTTEVAATYPQYSGDTILIAGSGAITITIDATIDITALNLDQPGLSVNLIIQNVAKVGTFTCGTKCTISIQGGALSVNPQDFNNTLTLNSGTLTGDYRFFGALTVLGGSNTLQGNMKMFQQLNMPGASATLIGDFIFYEIVAIQTSNVQINGNAIFYKEFTHTSPSASSVSIMGNILFQENVFVHGSILSMSGAMIFQRDFTQTAGSAIFTMLGSFKFSSAFVSTPLSLLINGNIQFLSAVTLSSGLTTFKGKTTILGQLTIADGATIDLVDVVFLPSSSVTYTTPRVISMINSNWTVPVSTQFRVFGTGGVNGNSNSFILNYGTISMIGNTTLTAPVLNYNQIYIKGSSSLHSAYFQYAKSNLTIDDAIVSVNGNLSIMAGYLWVSGSIHCNHLLFDSPDGSFKLLPPSRYLLINGTSAFSNRSTVILTLLKSNTDTIVATGSISLDSFTLIKLLAYTPSIGDRRKIIESPAGFTQKGITINLLGAPYKTCEVSFQNGDVNLEFVLSFGSISSLDYKCHYLGSQKVLEMNTFESRGVTTLSLTVPSKDAWIGFGFDFGGETLESTIATISKDGQIWEVDKSIIQPTGSAFIEAQSGKTLSVFDIGPEYITIVELISTERLKGQTKIFYYEIDSAVNQSTFVNLSSSSSVRLEEFPYHFGDQETECTNFLQPIRAEVYSQAVTGIYLAVYVIIFILCCCVWNKRPMNTRGISPYLTLFFLFAQLFMEIRNYFEIPSFQGSLCVYYSYGVLPLQQIVYVMILLYFGRYFAVINLNSNKKNIYLKLQGGGSVDRLQRVRSQILKIFVSSYVTLGFLIASYLFSIAIFTIVLLSSGFTCTFGALNAIKIINNVELIIIYAITILTLLGDMIPNWELILKFRWVQYIIYNDPYWFRLQILLFLPFMVYSFIVEVWSLAATSRFVDIATNFKPQLILNTISCALLLLIDVIFPLVITLINIIISFAKRKRRSLNGLEVVLANPVTREMFATFCQSEYSVENISCWQDIENWKVAKTDPMDIYTKYLDGNASVLEVNVPRGPCIEVLNKIKSGVHTVDLFVQIEKNVFQNLIDTWSRFQFSAEYEQYQKNEHTQLELIEGKK